jgi:hypothetical protein
MSLLTLSLREWKALEALIVHTTDAHLLRRAQALLWLDEGETVPEVAARLRVTRQAVYKWGCLFPNAQRVGPSCSPRARKAQWPSSHCAWAH